jgi:hypothetical protein
MDLFRVSKEEIDDLADAASKATKVFHTSYLYFQNPSLPDFSIEIKVPDFTTRIDFIRTKVDLETQKITNDSHGEYLLVVMSAGDDDLIIASFYAELRNDKEHGALIHTKPLFCAPGFGDNFKTKEELQIHLTSLVLIYLSIQIFLYNRPTVFREKKVRAVVSHSVHHKNQRKNQRKVKTYRVITINPDEVVSSPGGKRVITCPAYGVCGHFRHYKTGKTVWIKPYVKGKLRGVESVYSAKEYQITKGE